MKLGTRVSIGLVVLGGIVASAVTLSRGEVKEYGDLHGRQRFHVFRSSKECRACHAAVFDEWNRSHHKIAYTNPEVRKLSDDFRNKECQACHLPRPIFETGLGDRPLQRETRPDEGVDCFACHRNASGRIVGRHARPGAQCKPIRDEGVLGVSLCKSCHNQHQTTDQFLASDYATKGKNCNSCHMPEVDRGNVKGRSHVFAGCHDLRFLRQAGTMHVRIDGGIARVEVGNTGAGHNFPTEERHRCVDVVYRIVPAGQQAAPAFVRLYRFRQPYRGDPGPNTQLPAGKTWSGTIPLADAPSGSTLQVRLLYRLQPFLADADAQILIERKILVP